MRWHTSVFPLILEFNTASLPVLLNNEEERTMVISILRLPKQLGFVFLLVFLSIDFGAQSQDIDSLIKVLPKQKEDTNKVLLLKSIVRSYTYGDITQQPKYIAQMLALSKKLHYNYGEGMSYLSYADYYIRTRQHDLALKNVELAQVTYKKSNYRNGLAVVDNMYGNYYAATGKYEKALSSYQHALDYYEKTDNKNLQAATLGIIAKMFFELKRYDESEKYYLPLIEIYRSIGNTRAESVSLLNIGTLYFVQEKYTKAEKYFDRSMALQKELQDPSVIAQVLQAKGVFHAQRKAYGKSLNVLNEAYEMFDEIQDTLQMGYTRMFAADTYLKMKEYQKGLKVMDEALVLARWGRADSSMIGDFYNEYYKLYKAAGDDKNALFYYEKAVKNQSDLFSEETAGKISELKERYETEKKEKENQALKSRNQIQLLELKNNKYVIFTVVVLLVLVIFIALLMIRNNRSRSRERTARLQQQLLVSQMNPHFIFNSLNSIQNYIYKQDSLTAGRYLSRFADLMRMILDFSRKETITLYDEVLLLENYLSLQKLRFGDHLNYAVEVAEEIHPELTEIPPMLAQPFIENALEHGLFRGPDGTGKVTVTFRKKDDQLLLVIRDNGIGLKQSLSNKKDEQTKHTSLATVITQERIATWNRNTRSNAHFEVVDLANEHPERHGVEVIFTLPYRQML